MPSRMTAVSALCASLLLTGCGGDSAAPALPNHLMLADGNRWAYDYYLNTAGPAPTVTTLVTATAATLSSGEPVIQLEERSIGGVSFGFIISMLLQQDATGLASVVDVGAGAPPPFPNPLPLLRLPLRQSGPYDLYQYTSDPSYVDHDGDFITEPVTVTARVVEVEPETVTVPAGVFATLRVVRERRESWVNSSDGSAGSGVFIEREWYARGVGPVQRERDTGPIRERWALTRYRVDGRTTDATPPQVAATTPAAGASQAQASTSGLTLAFNEAIDPQSVQLQLVDASLQPVTSLLTYHPTAATEAQVTPVPALPVGSYTATLVQARDLMGNPVAAPHSWSFTLH